MEKMKETNSLADKSKESKYDFTLALFCGTFFRNTKETGWYFK